MRILPVPTRFQWYLSDISTACGDAIVLTAEQDSHKCIGAHIDAQCPVHLSGVLNLASHSYLPKDLMNFSPVAVKTRSKNDILAGISAEAAVSSEELMLLALCAVLCNWQCLSLQMFVQEVKGICDDILTKSTRAQCRYWIRKSFPLVNALYHLCSTVALRQIIHIESITHSQEKEHVVELNVPLSAEEGTCAYRAVGAVPAFAVWQALMQFLENRSKYLARAWAQEIACVHTRVCPQNFRAILPSIIAGLKLYVSSTKQEVLQSFDVKLELHETKRSTVVKSLYFTNKNERKQLCVYETRRTVTTRKHLCTELLRTLTAHFQPIIDSQHRAHMRDYVFASTVKKPVRHVLNDQHPAQSRANEPSLREFVINSSATGAMESAARSHIPSLKDTVTFDNWTGYSVQVYEAQGGTNACLVAASGAHYLPLYYLCFDALRRTLNEKQPDYIAPIGLQGIENFFVSCSPLLYEKHRNVFSERKDQLRALANAVAHIFGLKTLVVINGQLSIGFTVTAYVARSAYFGPKATGLALSDLVFHPSKDRSHALIEAEHNHKVEGIGFCQASALTDAVDGLLFYCEANLQLKEIRKAASMALLEHISPRLSPGKLLIIPEPTANDACVAAPCPLAEMRRDAAKRFNGGELLHEHWDGSTASLTSIAGTLIFCFRPPTESLIAGILSCYVNLLQSKDEAARAQKKAIVLWIPAEIRPFAFQITPLDHLMHLCEANFGLRVCVYTYSEGQAHCFRWVSEVYLSTDFPRGERAISALWLATASCLVKRDSRNKVALKALDMHFPGSVRGEYAVWYKDPRYSIDE